MYSHQIQLIESNPRLTVHRPFTSPTHEEEGFDWWVLPIPDRWLIVNSETGFVHIVDEPVITSQRVEQAILHIVRDNATDPASLDLSVDMNPDHMTWHLDAVNIPKHVEQRHLKVIELCNTWRKSSKLLEAVDLLNCSSLLLHGIRDISPEVEFEGIFITLWENYQHYVEHTDEAERQEDSKQGLTPWTDPDYELYG